MKRRFLSKSDIKQLNQKLADQSISYEFSKKARLELVEDEYYVENKECLFFIKDDKVIPTVRLLLKGDLLPKVTVDMGAVKFVAGGADIMRPGIVEVEEFENNTIVQIIDENNKKPLGIGMTTLSSEELMKETSGVMVKSIHYVGDDIWNVT